MGEIEYESMEGDNSEFDFKCLWELIKQEIYFGYFIRGVVKEVKYYGFFIEFV